MEYTLQLVEEKVKQQQVTALHLISSLAFLGAGIIIFRYNYDIPYYGLVLLLIALGLLILTIAKNRWVTTPGNNTILRFVELGLALALAIYSAVQQWRFPIGMFGILTAVLAFSIFWERKSNAAQFVTIDEEGIRLPSSARKRGLQWTEVEQVLLRFGTVSIDCADNHLYQWSIQQPAFDKDAFESFCSKQIESNREKRAKDDW